MKTHKDPRHEARRIALNTIYAKELGGVDTNIPYVATFLDVTKYNKDLLETLLKSYKINKEKLSQAIENEISTWNADQLLDIDLIAIKIAILEFLFLKITPVKVAVDEAVELAKEFGGEKSSKFVNGVLAKVIEKNKI